MTILAQIFQQFQRRKFKCDRLCMIGMNRLNENFTEKPGTYIKLLIAM
jgi:hypothetical protein